MRNKAFLPSHVWAAVMFAAAALGFPFLGFGADTTPPAVVSVTPAAGATLSNWSQIVVTFSEPVANVNGFDLLVNGTPAVAVSNSGNAYSFGASQPPPGGVTVRFDNNGGISDQAGNLLDTGAATNQWSYTLLDLTPPAALAITPVPGATVARLEAVEVQFNEAVTGVDAGDLLINGVPASAVTGSGAGPYHFGFPALAVGVVQFSWAAGHGITDLGTVPNAWAGGAWSNTVVSPAALGTVIINEFLANNVKGLSNEFRSPEDWIELYNPGPGSVNLLGWSLTDDQANPGLWTFPAVTLSAGQYLVVFADALDLKTFGGTNRLHTNFKLNDQGDYLALFSADLPRTAMTEFTNGYPDQRPDYSYGLSGTNGWFYYATPTPGATNGASAISGVAPLPHVSASRGLYDQPFTLVASSELPGATLRYTTDGSLPTEANGQLYTSPLTITNTTSFRLAAFATNRLPSRVSTHSYIFPGQVVYQPNNPAGYPVGTNVWSNYPSDYEMDPEIVTSNPAFVKASLMGLPTLSITMKIDDLFGPANGIYTHPVQSDAQRPLWERACSAEFILTNGQTGFSVDCGVRIQGNASRSPQNTPKHPFRLFFRGSYGPGRLDYPLFDDSPVTSFDTLVLRADYNNSWTHWDSGQRTRGNKVRDSWGKAAFRAINGLAGHNRPFHLYLNGLYWGVYDFGERVDAEFAASYLGGTKADYDALASKPTEAIDGDLQAYTVMTNIGRSYDMTQPANYTLIQQHLDVPNYIDYMMLNFFGANVDWGFDGNWNAVRRRVPAGPFKYSPWDGEQLLVNNTDNRVSNGDVPSGLHTNLIKSPQYLLDFADRAHRHCFNNGPLTPGPAAALWMSLADQVGPGMLAESARWGDYRRDVHQYQPAGPFALYTTNAHWWPEIMRISTSYFPQRTATFLSQLRAAGLYPNVTAPVFSQHGGRVARGYALTMTATNAIYYTTNGTDPRVPFTGAVSAGALLYTGPVAINASMSIQARALNGTIWSALNAASFDVAALGPQLHVTEIMYNPVGGDAYEFLELRNDGATTLDVSLWTFEGITFTFPAGTQLAPGQIIVLANSANPAAFATRYPGVSVFGWFGGRLSNDGERIALHQPTGGIVFSLDYGDSGGWSKAADGSGYSLEIIDASADPDAPANWSAVSYNGTPGTIPTAVPAAATVRLSEVMADNVSAVTNSGTFPDWVELQNTSTNDLDLGNWSLTDSSDARKYVFPGGTILGASGFLTVWCDTNAALPGLHTGFALGRNGGTVSLFDAATNRADALSYGLQLADLSVARVSGDWVLAQPTPGTTNLAAVVVSQTNLIINEWLANAPAGGADWIEIFNTATNPVPLRGMWLATSNSVAQLPALSFVGPLGHLQVFADEQAGAAHVDFKLPADGGAIVLYDNTATERNRVTYGPQTEGISQGRLPNGSLTITNFVLSASPGASNYVVSYSGPLLNEVLARNRASRTNAAGHAADWVELFNPLATDFDPAGFRLSTSLDNPAQWVFPLGIVIPANGYLLVWFDNLVPASLVNEAELNTGRALDGGSDEVCLFNPAGLLVDSVQFGPQAPDLSIGRSGGAWTALASPTPGTTNSAPAALASPSALRINEWLARPLPEQDQFFELFNPNVQPVALGGLFLTDDLSAPGLTKFQIAALSFVGPLDFTEFKADNDPSQGRDHVNFNLDGDAESLRLSSASLGLIDTVAFGLQSDGFSQGRYPDGTANTTNFSLVTPGAANSTAPVVVISVSPRSQTVAVGASVNFTITASGETPLSYQWFFNGEPISGAAAPSLTLNNVATSNAGNYFIIVTNSISAATSGVATLTVLLPPSIVTAPADVSVAPGDPANFGVTVSGSAPFAYQWRYRGQAIPGATSDYFSLAAVAPSNGGPYQVVISNSVGAITSAPAVLTVLGPPWIFSSPTNLASVAGRPATFRIDAGGTPPLAYQWFFQDEPLLNATLDTFGIASSDSTNAGSYFVVVSNTLGAATSAVATLTVLYTPSIITGPTNLTVIVGSSATFSVEATGTAPLTYRWLFQNQPMSGATSNRLVIAAAAVSNDGPYQVVVSNAAGTITSSVASLTVLVPLGIASQPQSQSVFPYTNVTFAVGVSGTHPSYQWRFNGTNLPSATNATLVRTGILPAHAGSYHVVITNSISAVTSTPALLTVWTNPIITQQPLSRSTPIGSNVTFTVVAVSSTPLRHQWYFNTNTILLNATNDSYTLLNVQATNYGYYNVRVWDSFGTNWSDPAQLADKLKPTITQQPTPASGAGFLGGNYYISVSAAGPQPLTYNLRKSGNVILSQTLNDTNCTFTLTNLVFTNCGSFEVIVTNVAGNAPNSSRAYLTVMDPLTNRLAWPGSNVAFSFQAASLMPNSTISSNNFLKYQWWFNQTNLVSTVTNLKTTATNIVLNLTNVQVTSEGLYSVVLTNANGLATTQSATLTILRAPVIAQQPTNQIVPSGADAAFSVSADGSAPLRYQWWHNQTNLLPGATAPTLTLPGAQPNQAGAYRVVITNSIGSVTSDVATLTVQTYMFTGLVELEGYRGPAQTGSGNRAVTFVATDNDGDPLATWTLPLDFVADTNRAAMAFFTITSAPPETVSLSAKTDWHLRRRLPAIFQDGVATMLFAGPVRLASGDLDGSNAVGMGDYSRLAAAWYTPADDADLDGSGLVDIFDYFLLASRWLQEGEPE